MDKDKDTFPEVVCLCGSTKFKDDFERINKELTLTGRIVISVAFLGHADNIPLTKEEKKILDWVHFRKIQLSDSIHVINKGGYIGDSTSNEINYAKALGLRITYMEE